MQIFTPPKKVAPVVVFAYNRPDHLQQTLDALAANTLADMTDVFVYTDGAKQGADQLTFKAILEVQRIAQQEKRFHTTTVKISEKNKGLAASIIHGVTEIVNQFGSVIVLEDDLITSPAFLSFMNDSLCMYEKNDEVACISGYIYPVKEVLPDTFFLKGADCWGWGTWKRAWDIFEPNGSLLLKELADKQLLNDFNFNNSFPYSKMLEDQIAGKNSSWAIRWYAAAYLRNMLTLYPTRSFVQNIGFDGSGTHSGKRNIWKGSSLAAEFNLAPLVPEENAIAKKAVASYFREIRKKTLTRRLRHIIGSLLRKFQ